MSGQIKTKFIEDAAITAAKIASGAIDATKISDGSITNVKIATGVDAVKIADGSVSNAKFQYLGNVTSDIQTQINAKISSSEKGANNGVATLDSGGKIPTAQLPNSVMEYKGQWNANTNSPTLADGTGNAGDVYRVSVAGTQNLGSGNITFAVGDWVMYSGTIWEKASNTNDVNSVNGQTGSVVLTTSNISEGSNLYFTDERAQDAVGTILTDSASIDFTYNDAGNTITAAVLPAGVDHNSLQNYSANRHIDHSAVLLNTNVGSGLSGGGDITASRTFLVNPTNATTVTAASGDLILIADVSDSNNLKNVTAQTIADLAGGATWNKQTFTLVSGDITNQYIDLAQVARNNSIEFKVRGGAPILEGASYDYSVSYTGGVGGKTRITFLNDLATGGASALIAGDVIQIIYQY